jgi:DNA-binding protein YbaB
VPEDPAKEMQRKAKEIERIAVEARGEAISEDGEVRVVAGAGDTLLEIDLRLKAFELSGVELGELIVRTIDDANQKVQADLAEAVGAIMGLPVSPSMFDGTPETFEREGDQR